MYFLPILVMVAIAINYLKLENMYIQLKPEHEQFIQAQMASGRYENAEDVIAKALKLNEPPSTPRTQREEIKKRSIIFTNDLGLLYR